MKIFKILIWQRQLWRQRGINIYLIDRQILCQKRNVAEATLLRMQAYTIWRIFCCSGDISTSCFVMIDVKKDFALKRELPWLLLTVLAENYFSDANSVAKHWMQCSKRKEHIATLQRWHSYNISNWSWWLHLNF